VPSLLTPRVREVVPPQTAAFVDNKVRRKFGINRAEQARRTPWHMLRGNSDFRLYFFGSVTSDFGTWLQNSAQVLLAYQLTHSVFTVGLVTFAQFTSPLVLGPWAGVLTDRCGGRRTLLTTQIVSALVAATLAGLDFGGVLDAWGLGACAVVGGLAFTFALPARNVTVQRLVPRDKLKPAYAMDTVSYNLGRALAPLLTVAMGLAGISLAWSFAANALSFIAFSVILWRVHMHAQAEPERRSKVRDGFRIAHSDRRITILLLMVAAVTIADDPILVQGPALAKHLHLATGLSSCFIAALGVGTVLGSFRPSMHRPSLRLAATALAGLALCMLLFVHAPTMWFGVVAAMGAGASCLIANSVTRAVLAERAGPEETAAVMAVWAIAWAGSKPFAALIDGTLGGLIGLQWTGLILAAPALIPFLVIMLEPLIRLWAAKWHAGQLAVRSPGATGNAKSRSAVRGRRHLQKSLVPFATLTFQRQSCHHSRRYTDDNKACGRHNQHWDGGPYPDYVLSGISQQTGRQPRRESTAGGVHGEVPRSPVSSVPVRALRPPLWRIAAPACQSKTSENRST
jgi:MFS family permease